MTIQHIQIRRDTALNWTTNNPLLKLGEPGLETDTNKLKFGNGVDSWNALVYYQTEVLENNYGRLLAFMGG